MWIQLSTAQLPDVEMIALFKGHHACLIATISPALPYAKFDREVSHITETEQYNGQVVFNGILDCAKACLENDIPVVWEQIPAVRTSRTTICGGS